MVPSPERNGTPLLLWVYNDAERQIGSIGHYSGIRPTPEAITSQVASAPLNSNSLDARDHEREIPDFR